MHPLARRPVLASTDDPIRRSIELRVPVERAFAAWTEHMDRWWPPAARFQPGSLTLSEPPHRLGFRITLDGAVDSEVVVRFRPTGPSSCRVEVEHLGWQAQTSVMARHGRQLGTSLEVSPAPAVACGGCGARAMALPAFRLLR